jgi:hypothetical protein
VWSMDGRNVEGLHTISGICIKDKCQLCVKLHVALLLCICFYGFFPMYVACVLLVLFHMYLCICIVFVYV